jgi:hypothetical protein
MGAGPEALAIRHDTVCNLHDLVESQFSGTDVQQQLKIDSGKANDGESVLQD